MERSRGAGKEHVDARELSPRKRRPCRPCCPVESKEFSACKAAVPPVKSSHAACTIRSLVMERFLGAGKEPVESRELSPYKRWLCHRSLVMERFLGAGKEPIESKEFSPRKRWLCHQVVIVVQRERSDDWLSAQLRVLQDQKIVSKVLLLYNEPLSLDKTELEVTYRPAASSDPLECLIAVLADLEDEFILIAGSGCFYCDFSLLVNFVADKKAVLALQYADELRDEPQVGIDDNYQVTEYQSLVTWREGTRDSYFASGICYFKREVLEEAARNSVKTGLKDYYLRLIEQRQLFGLPLAGCYAKSDFTKTIAAFLKQPLIQALFLDKDGTLIKNSGYPSGPQIEIVPELVPLIANYQKEHFCLFIVTNQSGIARGKYGFEALKENLAAICGYYAKAGVKFTEVVYCPYLPEAPLKRYCFDVLARKPYPGMFLKLGAKYRIDWYRSIMIGDNPLADRIRLPYLKTLIIGDDLKFPSF